MSPLARLLVLGGILLVAAGLVVEVAGRVGFGRLPGDLSWRTGHLHVYAPVATSLLVSVVATVLLNLFLRR